VHNLGVARDDGNTGIGGGQCHRFRKRPQRIDLKTLLNDRAAGEVKRNSPATAKSLMVPQTASLPMSPPGKNNGSTT